jgi:superfamily II DNA/RNA helicase
MVLPYWLIGWVDIVVVMPGRLEDLISTGQLSLRYRYTVLPYWLIGWVDIVVVMPGRLEDLISTGQLFLRYRYMVLPYWLIGWVDIVVATPGHLEDLISTGQLSLRYRYFLLPYWWIGWSLPGSLKVLKWKQYFLNELKFLLASLLLMVKFLPVNLFIELFPAF